MLFIFFFYGLVIKFALSDKAEGGRGAGEVH